MPKSNHEFGRKDNKVYATGVFKYCSKLIGCISTNISIIHVLARILSQLSMLPSKVNYLGVLLYFQWGTLLLHLHSDVVISLAVWSVKVDYLAQLTCTALSGVHIFRKPQGRRARARARVKEGTKM